MAKAMLWGVLIIATGVVIAGLFFFRSVLVQLALALILWLAIQSVSAHFRRFLPQPLRPASTTFAVIAILALFGFVGYEIVLNVGNMAGQEAAYEAHLNALIKNVYGGLHVSGDPPTVNALVTRVNVTALLYAIAGAFRSVADNAIFILIYLAFLFPAANRIHGKLDRIFPGALERAHVSDVLTAIRGSMAQYLWVQTVLAALIAAMTYVTLLVCGLHNALFWAFLTFFLNFIPALGPVVAVALPILFALVQFSSLGSVFLVAGGLILCQFVVANLVQPRMMGESLNLSSLVVLLALALWGVLWGVAGAFLSAPLTVMIMLVLAQFPSTRWVAILLSEDGEPGVARRALPKITAELAV